MKFGKEFTAQMVPEWQQAYMDYNFLKSLLKNIQKHRQKNQDPQSKPGLHRKMTLYRAFSGLTNHHRNDTTHASTAPSEQDVEDQAILVRKSDGDKCGTTFLKAAEDGGQLEIVYFRNLDEELEKVSKFYKAKVDEVVQEAEMLNKQMNAFIAFRVKVEHPDGFFAQSEKAVEMRVLASDISASSAALSASSPSGVRSKRALHMAVMDVIEEGSSRGDSQSEQEKQGEAAEVSNADDGDGKMMMTKKKNKIVVDAPLPPLQVLDNVKMHKSLETPRSTIKGFLNNSKHAQLTFNKENFKKIEEKLKQAFLVFHQKLDLLKRFSFLNILAFSKIMKKYDKITSRNASKTYMTMVDASYLGSSEEVNKLMERVEQTFIKHFCNSNHNKGMNILRPKPKRERHVTSFAMGFFAGCMVALIVALALIIRARKILDSEGSTTYMETLFPLYSLFGFIVLHMLMYAGNIYFWRKYRVNYSFIFGCKEGTEMRYRDMLLLSFGLAVLSIGCVLANLDMEMDSLTKDYKPLTELVPLFLVLFIIVILFLPFNIIYRSSRFFFIASLLHCIAAPLYKVTLPDFLLADQLTSQVQAFRSMEFYICYYVWGDYKHRENTCSSNDVYNTFYFLVAVIPYWCRLLQCLRRFFEEKDSMQGWNGLKYFLTIVAVCFRTAYSLNKGPGWNKIAWVFSIIAAIFGTYWDLVKDWGLLQMKSKNFLLRDKLLVPYKSIYFAAMVSNVLLRLAWMQTVLDLQVSFLHGQALIAVVASLEIIRRGIWNFFRLENEHLNNVGKYRAFKSVPFPFNYEEEEEKDD